MQRIALADDEAKSSSVVDVLAMLSDLVRLAPVDVSLINLEMQMDGDVSAAALFEDTLTDGSKVYSIQLR